MRQFEVDFKHSTIQFSIQYMKLSKVKGFFDSYKAKIEFDALPDVKQFSIYFEVDVASISTHDFHRDAHLISADFFYADKYPKIKFEATDIEKITANTYLLGGNLTIKDCTNYVKFNVFYNGSELSTLDTVAHGFTCITSIYRSDFKLSYNKLLESGNFLIDDEVEIHVELILYE